MSLSWQVLGRAARKAVTVDDVAAEAYPRLVTKGTIMSPERGSPNRDESDPPAVGATGEVQAVSHVSLDIAPQSASADDVEVYPQDRFLAALDGRVPMHAYAVDALGHVEARLARRQRAVGTHRTGRATSR
jgi:hypothetical protein